MAAYWGWRQAGPAAFISAPRDAAPWGPRGGLVNTGFSPGNPLGAVPVPLLPGPAWPTCNPGIVRHLDPQHPLGPRGVGESWTQDPGHHPISEKEFSGQAQAAG